MSKIFYLFLKNESMFNIMIWSHRITTKRFNNDLLGFKLTGIPPLEKRFDILMNSLKSKIDYVLDNYPNAIEDWKKDPQLIKDFFYYEKSKNFR